MKRETTVGLIALVAVGLTAGGWFLIPSMESAGRSVESAVSTHFERARRLLHKYELGLSYKAVKLEQIAEAGVDVDVEDADALVDSAADTFQEHHEALWEQFHPTDWSVDPPRPRRANYGNLARQINEGIDGRADLLADNERLLDDAMASVERAMAVSIGDASGRSHAEAIRLKGVILYYQGIAEVIRASARRRDATPYRQKIATSAIAFVGEQGSTSTFEASGMSQTIRDFEREQAQARADYGEKQKSLKQLGATIAQMEARQGDAIKRRDAARQRMEQLIADGVDLADPNGADAFQHALLEQDKAFRAADREVQTLEAGSFPKATIEDRNDLLHGRFVEDGRQSNFTLEHGLRYHRQTREVMANQLEYLAEAQQGRADDIARLEAMSAALHQDELSAKRRMAAISDEANRTYAELSRIESEAFAAEEDALDLLERAAKAASQAATQAAGWVRNAGKRTAGMSPQAVERSAFGKRQKDGWMGAFITAQVAQARLAKARIHFDRYRWYSQNADLLGRFSDVLNLREASANAATAKADEAKEQGVEEIEQAMTALQNAHRGADRHWTFVAQSAGAMQLMALFGQEGYNANAVEAYRSVLKGRETEPGLDLFAGHLNRLENR